MKKTWRNGDVVIRISDISAVSIPAENQRQINIYVRGCTASFVFNCESCKHAESVLDNLQKLIEESPE